MVFFIAKLVFCGEGSSISFEENISFSDFRDKIRMRFAQLENLSFRLKYTVHPDKVVFQLENDDDMWLLFRNLDDYKSGLVDVSIHATSTDLRPVKIESVERNADNDLRCVKVESVERDDIADHEGVSGFIETNEYLGSFRREDSVERDANNDLRCVKVESVERDDIASNEDVSGFIETNEYLGSFRREDSKLYMSSSWKYYISFKGQSFEGGVKEFRLKLRMYAIEVGFEYVFETNKAERVIAVCKKKSPEGCNWSVKASLCRYNGFFVIYSLLNEHQCRSVDRLQKSKMLSSDIVKEVILEKVRDNPNAKAIEIQQDLKLNYGLDIPYHKAWYGKELAKKVVLGVENDSYRELK